MSAEKPLSDINFFICSTYVDLIAYRDAVIKKIQSHAGVINAQEFFGARDQKPLATCLEELDRSNVFVMFLGPRYGSVDGDSGKSFVECEYEHAKKKGMHRFVYLIDKSHPFPIEYVSTGDDAIKLHKFEKLVQSELTTDFFTTADDLAEKVYNDLLRELPKKGFKLGKAEPQSNPNEAHALLKQFLALPKLFHGRTITLTVKLSGYSRANEAACEAFSYRYGAAIAREFEATDKLVQGSVRRHLSDIYASEEKALAFMALPSDSEIRLVLKTVQGTHETQTPVYGFENGLSAYTMSPSLRNRVVVDHQATSHLICGLEFVEIADKAIQ